MSGHLLKLGLLFLVLGRTADAQVLTGPQEIVGSEISGNLGGAVTTAGDVNGDGYSDLAVAVDGLDTPLLDGGQVRIYHGSASGIAPTPSTILAGSQEGGRHGSTLAPLGDVNGDGFDDLLVGTRFFDMTAADEGAVFLYLGSPSGLASDPSWSVTGQQFNSGFGIAIDGAGDVNGDGFADILVGASNHDGNGSDEGRVLVYHGSATGPAMTADWVLQGTVSNAFLGRGVAGVGDIDGDGFSDVCIGAPTFGVGGAAFVYHGSATGLSLVADAEILFAQGGAQFGRSLAGAGDVNGDGFADVLVGARRYDNGQNDEGGAFLYLGSAAGLVTTVAWSAEGEQSGAQAGTWVAGVGDLDGDGFAEIAVGAPLHSSAVNEVGRVRVYRGGAAGPALEPLLDAIGDESGAGFGSVIDAAGDLDGDGFGELIVGAPSSGVGASAAGRAFFWGGAARLPNTTADWTRDGDQTGALWGSAVAGGGDVNGDGFADVLIGSRRVDVNFTDDGEVALYLGSATGPADVAAWTAAGNQFNEAFAVTVADAGDVNGDGYSDVLVGAPNYDGDLTDEGRAQLYLGSATGLATTPVWEVEGDQEFCFFGRFVTGAGDVNGDGFADVLVGSPEYDAGEIDEGRALLYLGSALGLALVPDWTFDGDQAAAAFGRPVAAAGDVNGDGFSDVAISARRYDAGESNEGRVFVFLGESSGLSALPAWTFDGDQDNALLGVSVAAAGDVDGDGFDDLLLGASGVSAGEVEEGRAYLFRGSASGLSLLPDWSVDGEQVDAHLGSSLAGVGDINGDGYSDVIVGADGFDGDLRTDEGRVSLYLGGVSGLSSTPAWSLSGGQDDARFGFALSSAGDVDGNGFADFIVAADGFDADEVDEGRVFLFLGNPGGVSCGIRQRQSVSDRLIPMGGLTEASDAFSLTGSAHSAAGRGALTLEWQALAATTTTGSAAATFGAVSSASIAGLEPATPYRWRARWVSNNARFPHSPWFAPFAQSTASASVRTSDVLAGVERLTCTVTAAEALLEWQLVTLYDNIEVLRDGIVVASLAGDATSYSDPGLAVGSYAYEVFGVLLAETSTVRGCVVDRLPASAQDLVCVAGPGAVTLSWQEGQPYEATEVLRDGLLIATLPAGATSFADVGLSPGSYTYTVTGLVSAFASPSVPCDAVVPEPSSYRFEVLAPPFEYQPETGTGSGVVTLQLTEVATNAGFPNGVQGVSMALSWNGPIVATRFDGGLAVGALNAGAGPDFVGSELNADSAVLVLVASFMDPTEVLASDAPLAVGELQFDTVVPSLAGDFVGGDVALQWQDGLGSGLPVDNSVVVNADTIAATLVDGSLSLVPTLRPFKRGDCNATGNINISDVIFLLNAFFLGGSVECLDACDTNDSGAIDLADAVGLAFHLFSMGAPPAAPYPECGTDGFADTIGCDGGMSCP